LIYQYLENNKVTISTIVSFMWQIWSIYLSYIFKYSYLSLFKFIIRQNGLVEQTYVKWLAFSLWWKLQNRVNSGAPYNKRNREQRIRISTYQKSCGIHSDRLKFLFSILCFLFLLLYGAHHFPHFQLHQREIWERTWRPKTCNRKMLLRTTVLWQSGCKLYSNVHFL